MRNNNLICDMSTGLCSVEPESSIERVTIKPTYQKVKIQYFTDPICSACWALEPVLKRLNEEYGQYFTLEHRMGGLLKSWDGFRDSANGISKPSDVAHHWDDIGQWSDMPIDGDVWLEDPLASSFPACIAFKAAELQGKRAAELFLRRIREMVFVEKKNIAKEQNLLLAAVDVGIDANVFLQSIKAPETKLLFDQDMKLARELHIRGFPTLVFGNEGDGLIVKGVAPYEKYVSTLQQIVGNELIPEQIHYSAEEIVNKYGFVSTREVAEVMNLSITDVLEKLERAAKSSMIVKIEMKNGVYWKKTPR